MKRIFILSLLLSTLLLEAGTQKAAAQQTKDKRHEIRAVWLTTIGGLDWPHCYAKNSTTVNRQKKEFTNILDRLRRIGINTVLLQTRVRGTVIYPSELEPWDGCISGIPGKSPGYDPLLFAIEECHKRGMELHAWIVTIPVGKWNGLGCRTLQRKYPSLLRKIGTDGYMNPEKAETGDIIAKICREITERYDVDGIHLDYIRYPETWKLKVSKQEGRRHITGIVRKVHDAVKSAKPHVKLSCSPIGKFDDLSRFSSHGWNAYNKGCQDAQGWLRSGLMDQLYPMMYFKGNQFYPFAFDWMENSYGKDISAGLGIYFLDSKEGNWKIEEIKRQMNVARSLGIGICFFRAEFLLDNVQGLYDYMLDGYDAVPVLANIEKEYHKNDSVYAQTNNALKNDGKRMILPPKGKTLDADYIIIESFEGAAISTKAYKGEYADINDIPDGMYYIRSLNKKGITHRMGYTVIKR